MTFPFRGEAEHAFSQMESTCLGPAGFVQHVSVIGVVFRYCARMSPGTKTMSNIFEAQWMEPKPKTLLSKPLT